MDVHKIYTEATEDLRRLRSDLAELQRQVAGLERVVEGLQVLDPSLLQEQPAVTPPAAKDVEPPPARDTTAPPTGVNGVEIRRRIFEILAASGHFLSSQELVDALVAARDLPDDLEAAETVRKIVSRLASEKKLSRQRRDGRSYNYGLPGPVGDADQPDAREATPAPPTQEYHRLVEEAVA